MSVRFDCHPVLMGILNVTPDSFSETGQFVRPDLAIARGRQLFQQGADIVDVGGEASGPGSRPCSAEEELRRILPVVEELADLGTISVDTTKSAVAREALARGAGIINDISGLRHDLEMVRVVADAGASLVIMFSKESGQSPLVSESRADYADVISHIRTFFEQQIEFAMSSGLKSDQIILDPGMGRFVSHDPAYSWEILWRLKELKDSFTEFSFLLGISRKGFLGGAIGDRDRISQVLGAHAATRGVSILRTHDVRMASELQAILAAAS